MRLMQILVDWGDGKQRHHLIDPERIVCVVVSQKKYDDGRLQDRLSLYLDGFLGNGGESDYLVITDPPSIDRILDLEKTD